MDIIRGMGKMTIRFVSDDSVNYRGFQATFQSKLYLYIMSSSINESFFCRQTLIEVLYCINKASIVQRFFWIINTEVLIVLLVILLFCTYRSSELQSVPEEQPLPKRYMRVRCEEPNNRVHLPSWVLLLCVGIDLQVTNLIEQKQSMFKAIFNLPYLVEPELHQSYSLKKNGELKINNLFWKTYFKLSLLKNSQFCEFRCTCFWANLLKASKNKNWRWTDSVLRMVWA